MFLRSLDQRADVIAFACSHEDAPTGEGFPCLLPGHAKDGTARVEIRPTRVVYVCDCDNIERSLTEVYVTRLTGIPRKRTKREYVLWKVRLAVEAGALIPPRVTLPPLPANATEYAHAVYSGLRLFVTVRALTDPGEPFTFTRRFAAEWCGLNYEQANAGTKSLIRAGVLVNVGTVPSGKHHANLYTVGTAT